jgi:NAD(P)-dependent dehydrogenase (short-subunit alcohol dehydrogenase family)
MARFTDRNVIVTGGAQGIGRGIVQAFLSEGARVFAADILADGLERMRAETDPDRVSTHQVDLSDFDAAKAMVTEGIERLGTLHALVNCAGTMPGGPLIDVTKETFDLIFAVNARSPEAPYNASKAALVALTKAAAHEWGHLNIRANCVAPGQTITPEEEVEIAADPHEARLQREYLRRIPLQRAGVPRDQAMAVLFLASDDAAWISGQTLIVDGGELGGGDWYDPAEAPPLPDE